MWRPDHRPSPAVGLAAGPLRATLGSSHTGDIAMRSIVTLASCLASLTFAPPALAFEPATPIGAKVPLACSGPEVAAGHRLVAREKLPVGNHPKACFGHMTLYEGPNRQVIAAQPSARCPGALAIQIYEQSRAGPWSSLFETPVCGRTASAGPKDRWGAMMVSIDGRPYDQRGAYYIPAR